jgi:hypothetical protein
MATRPACFEALRTHGRPAHGPRAEGGVLGLRQRALGCVGVRPAAAPGTGTGWGDRPAELASDLTTAELHGLYLAPGLRCKGLGYRCAHHTWLVPAQGIRPEI